MRVSACGVVLFFVVGEEIRDRRRVMKAVGQER